MGGGGDLSISPTLVGNHFDGAASVTDSAALHHASRGGSIFLFSVVLGLVLVWSWSLVG